jgi:hypothetical protein
MFVVVWTCKLSFSAPTTQHSISWEVINCPKKDCAQCKILLSPYISCFNTIILKLLELQYKGPQKYINIHSRRFWTNIDKIQLDCF